MDEVLVPFLFSIVFFFLVCMNAVPENPLKTPLDLMALKVIASQPFVPVASTTPPPPAVAPFVVVVFSGGGFSFLPFLFVLFSLYRSTTIGKMVVEGMTTSSPPRWTRFPIRARPHRNPLAENSDEHPDCPLEFQMRCTQLYPSMRNPVVEIVDVGCAFGGMLFSLSQEFPEVCMLGLEIRPKVVQFAQEKTLAFREGATDSSHRFCNLWFEQMNVMKFGSNCFHKGQLRALFFCYPDPHWKKKNIRRRIISPGLVHEYAYWLKVGGLLFTVSDVEELEQWMVSCLDDSPLFRRLSDEELKSDSVTESMLRHATDSSEDAQRTIRKGLHKHYAVHVRI